MLVYEKEHHFGTYIDKWALVCPQNWGQTCSNYYKYLHICDHPPGNPVDSDSLIDRNPNSRGKFSNLEISSNNKIVYNEAGKQSYWTEQAENVFPFLVSDQHPPLLIAHLPGPKAI